jgi:broad specificity phosphatase PhoE
LIVSREHAGVKPAVWMVRHGETEWSAALRHTGRTDIDLTDAGRAAAAALRPHLAGPAFALVLTSPAARSQETARLAGFPNAQPDPDLRERDYGEFEGLTSDEIRARGPEWRDWSVWTGALPGGESPEAVAQRAHRVLARADAAAGDVLLFGHGHQLRILTAVALDLDPRAAVRFLFDPASWSVLGWEREVRAVRTWNRGS